VEFSPDGSCLVGCGASGLYRWPIARQDASETSAGRIGPPRKTALPPGGSAGGPWRHSLALDGRTLALTLGEALVVLDVASGQEKLRVGRIPGLSGAVISPDGRWVVCVNWGGEGTRVIDVASGANVLSLEHGDSSGAAFSGDGRWLAIARTAEYRLWSVGSWEPGLRIEREVVSGAAGEMAFSPDGRILAIAPSCNVVRLVEPASGRELATLEAPGVQMRAASVCFSGDGSLLAAASVGKVIHVWNLRLVRQRLGEMRLDW
jgi:WD40 repeat protein